MRLELVIGHDEIETAVSVVVGELGAHTGARLAVAAHRDTRRQRHFAEAPLPLVVKQKVRHRIVGDEHIRQPVIVVIADGDAKTVADNFAMPASALTSVNTPFPSLRYSTLGRPV